MTVALLLSPSRGQGGGIERYVQSLQWAFDLGGVESRRLTCGASARLPM